MLARQIRYEWFQSLIKELNDQTTDLCTKALKHDYYAYKFIKNMTDL
jgi:hypothetical protein